MSGEPLKTFPAATRSIWAAAALAGLLATTACGNSTPGSVQTSPATSPPASTTTIGAATSSAAASAAATPQSTPAPIAVPGSPAPQALQTFTFPDGHISFTYPTGWTVEAGPGPALNPEDQKNSIEAIIRDEAGSEVARVGSGMYGDGAAGPAKRTVLDHGPVTGITDTSGEATEFGFAYDEYPGSPGGPYYFMDARKAKEFLATTGSSGSNQITLPNGVLTAGVVFDEQAAPAFKPAFASPADAKAWLGTKQYAHLKALLLSLAYR